MTTAANSLQKAYELHRAGQLAEAERLCGEVLAAEPQNIHALHLLGVAAHQQRQHAKAIEYFGRAIQIDPNQAAFHRLLSAASMALGRVELAIASMREVIRLEPNNAKAQNDLGVLFANLGRWDEAAVCFQNALAVQPSSQDAATYNNLGAALMSAGKFREAIVCFENALKLDASLAEAHNGLGAAFQSNQQFEEAMAAFERALAIKPDYADAHMNRGLLLAEQRQFTEALASFDRAEGVQPGSASLHVNRAVVLLWMGNFAAGWPEYEWRWQLPAGPKRPEGPQWDGGPLEGRTILLFPEGGLGDAMQFIRYAPLVKARGARVIVGCPKRMVPILSTCRGIDEFHTTSPPPPFDVHAALLSLPGILGTDLDSIPADVPYLSVAADLVEQWGKQLACDGSLRVGINWQGDPSSRWHFQRSMPLAEFAPLANVEGVRLFSLQKGPGIEQLALAPFAVEDLGSRCDEGDAAFCDTAAVIKNLDLVITCDTAVAHLAGALGTPVWVALSFSPEWRWLLDREDSPWYPTMRLFRQQVPGDWSGVFLRIAGELRRAVDARRVARPPEDG